MKRIAVLASGKGSNLEAIFQAAERGELEGRVVLVISDRQEAGALERARQRGVKALYIDPRPFAGRVEYDRAIMKELEKEAVDLVVLAGFMRLLSKEFVDAYPHRIMNIHPALLPSFPGTEGVKDALEYGVKVTGCTVHFVDEGMDTGPIILQGAVEIKDDDTVETLHQRIQEVEHRLYPRAINLFARTKSKSKGEGVLSLSSTKISTKRAIISVSDKRGVVELAQRPGAAGLGDYIDGGTAAVLKEAGVAVKGISEITGFPEILEGRVKTLHPKVHGGSWPAWTGRSTGASWRNRASAPSRWWW